MNRRQVGESPPSSRKVNGDLLFSSRYRQWGATLPHAMAAKGAGDSEFAATTGLHVLKVSRNESYAVWLARTRRNCAMAEDKIPTIADESASRQMRTLSSPTSMRD